MSPRRQDPGSTPATMRDIAAAAAVSQSTVSRVLSGVPTSVPIAPETRERVIQASRRLGYRPNPLARGLRGASTNLIGAVVRDFSDPFFAGAIEALVVESMAHGYNVVLGHVARPPRRGDLADLGAGDPAHRRHRPARRHAGPAPAAGRPAQLAACRWSALWQGTSPLEFPTADTDDRAGIRAGLEHLAVPRAPADRVPQRRAARRLPGPGGRLRRLHARAVRRRARRLPRALPEHPGRRRRRAAAPAGAARAADRGGHLDRPGRRRRPARRPQPRRHRARPAVGRGLRRHPDRQPHGARADHAADADLGDRQPRRRPRGRPGPRPGRRARAEPRGLQARR